MLFKDMTLEKQPAYKALITHSFWETMQYEISHLGA